MKHVSGSIVLQTKGFILGYCLYLLIFLFSFTTLISSSIYNKAKIEKHLVEMERQKCIELVLYSYFMNNQSEDCFSVTQEDYTIDYNCYDKNNKVYLDAKISSTDHSYTIRYIYSKDTNWIEDVVYIT